MGREDGQDEALFDLSIVSPESAHGSIATKHSSALIVAIILLSSLSFMAFVDSDEVADVPVRSATVTASSFVISPASAYAGEIITFTATATSDVGTTLTFTIFYDFILSDGVTPNPASPVSVNVTGNPGEIKTEYVYDAPGPIGSRYYVRLSITDGIGVLKNLTRAVAIYENTAPYFAPDLATSLYAPLDDETFTASLNMSVTCWDNDNDNLSLTWDFGDGSAPVEQWTGPALVGVECFQNHTWTPDPELWYGVGDANITYHVNLSLADGQGHWTNTSTLLRIPLDHNFSPVGDVSVSASTVVIWDVVATYEVVTIYGTASDAEGEPLTWTYVFSNETEVIHAEVYNTGSMAPGATVFQNTSYVFSIPGDYIVTLYLTDLALPELQTDPDFAAHNVTVGGVFISSLNYVAHTILKDENGPPSTCAEEWYITPIEDGTWYGHVVNNGMRWLIIDVVDIDAGDMLIDREMYRYAVVGDEFDTAPVSMKAGHTYMITATPNGPLGTSCTVWDVFEDTSAPVLPAAAFTVTVDGLDVFVDASAERVNGFNEGQSTPFREKRP